MCVQEAAEKKGKADEETQEKVKKVKAAEHEKRAKSDANLAAHKALGGDKAKWARWSKSNAGGTKKGAPYLPAFRSSAYLNEDDWIGCLSVSA